jgi:hypothetical protein
MPDASAPGHRLLDWRIGGFLGLYIRSSGLSCWTRQGSIPRPSGLCTGSLPCELQLVARPTAAREHGRLPATVLMYDRTQAIVNDGPRVLGAQPGLLPTATGTPTQTKTVASPPKQSHRVLPTRPGP